MPLMLLLTFVGLYCFARALLAMPADPIGSLYGPAVVIGGSVLVVIVLCVRGGQSLRTYRFRINPGGAPGATIDHEVAHAEVGNRHGGRTVAGRVYPDGSGWVDVRMPFGAPLSHDIAVGMAGAKGESANFWTSPHAAGDRAIASDKLAHLSDEERAKVYREADLISTPGIWYSGSAPALRRALETTGRYG